MADLLFSNKAVEDLTHIWNYTVETWSEAQADKYYAMLVATCRQIADSSRPLGREYTEIMAELYGYRTGKHIVFYRTVSGECRRDRENPARTHGFETPHRRVRFGITGKPTAVPSACSLDIALFLPAAPAPAAALFNSAFDLLDICGKLGQQVVYILFAGLHLIAVLIVIFCVVVCIRSSLCLCYSSCLGRYCRHRLPKIYGLGAAARPVR